MCDFSLSDYIYNIHFFTPSYLTKSIVNITKKKDGSYTPKG